MMLTFALREFAACYNYALPIGDQTEELFDVEIAPLLSGLYEGKVGYPLHSRSPTTNNLESSNRPLLSFAMVSLVLARQRRCRAMARFRVLSFVQWRSGLVYCEMTLMLIVHIIDDNA